MQTGLFRCICGGPTPTPRPAGFAPGPPSPGTRSFFAAGGASPQVRTPGSRISASGRLRPIPSSQIFISGRRASPPIVIFGTWGSIGGPRSIAGPRFPSLAPGPRCRFSDIQCRALASAPRLGFSSSGQVIGVGPHLVLWSASLRRGFPVDNQRHPGRIPRPLLDWSGSCAVRSAAMTELGGLCPCPLLLGPVCPFLGSGWVCSSLHCGWSCWSLLGAPRSPRDPARHDPPCVVRTVRSRRAPAANRVALGRWPNSRVPSAGFVWVVADNRHFLFGWLLSSGRKFRWLGCVFGSGGLDSAFLQVWAAGALRHTCLFSCGRWFFAVGGK